MLARNHLVFLTTSFYKRTFLGPPSMDAQVFPRMLWKTFVYLFPHVFLPGPLALPFVVGAR